MCRYRGLWGGPAGSGRRVGKAQTLPPGLGWPQWLAPAWRRRRGAAGLAGRTPEAAAGGRAPAVTEAPAAVRSAPASGRGARGACSGHARVCLQLLRVAFQLLPGLCPLSGERHVPLFFRDVCLLFRSSSSMAEGRDCKRMFQLAAVLHQLSEY